MDKASESEFFKVLSTKAGAEEAAREAKIEVYGDTNGGAILVSGFRDFDSIPLLSRRCYGVTFLSSFEREVASVGDRRSYGSMAAFYATGDSLIGWTVDSPSVPAEVLRLAAVATQTILRCEEQGQGWYAIESEMVAAVQAARAA